MQLMNPYFIYLTGAQASLVCLLNSLGLFFVCLFFIILGKNGEMLKVSCFWVFLDEFVFYSYSFLLHPYFAVQFLCYLF